VKLDESGELVRKKLKDPHAREPAADVGRNASMEHVPPNLKYLQRRQVVNGAWEFIGETVEGKVQTL
jgi:hypothetical protein